MSTKGQTINDRLNAAKYTLAGQALARCICKATTEELMRPKKKHLDYLAACTYESNVSMQQLANMLIERTNHTNWAVVYKALITVHHLMSFGSERFTQYLASSNYSFQLSGFLDRIVTKGYAMSTFIRRHSNYINQKALSYRTLALDLCRAQRGEDNILRSMPIERLLETLPVIQKQLDAIFDFGCTASDLSNSIIVASFTLLFHDAIRLFASYNDGIINLFEKYFDLNKKMCRDAFEVYKKFLACTDRFQEFLQVAKTYNLGCDSVPNFTRAPSSLLEALEEHLLSLESNKKRGDKVVIDTKLAAFPSFSVSNNTDYTPPPLGTIAMDFEQQLMFSSAEESDFDKALASSPSPKPPATSPVPNPTPIKSKATSSNPLDFDIDNNNGDEVVNMPPPPPMPSKPPAVLSFESDFDTQLSSTPMGELKNDAVFGSGIAASSNITPTAAVATDIFDNVPNNLLDLKPPGYSGGSLLTPEPTIQICMDPSIDPHTQNQLIQIQREQAANKHKQSGNNGAFASDMASSSSFSTSSNRQNNNYASTRSNTSKSKHESIFEDLELTMRQSLQKVEKA